MEEINIEDYLNKIIKCSGLSKEEVLRLAQERREELNRLISNEGALFVIGKELGVDFKTSSEDNETKSAPHPDNFYNFYEIGFTTKKDFITFLKEKLFESPESFRDEAFPLVRDVRDCPDLIAIIKNEVLKDEIEKINDVTKFKELPGEMARYYNNKHYDDLYNVGPEVAFNQTILETGVSDIFIIPEGVLGSEIYVAGVETTENAIDFVIYEIFPEFVESQDFEDFGGTDMSEYLSYRDLDVQIARALKYLELKTYLTQDFCVYDAKDLQKDERYNLK